MRIGILTYHRACNYGAVLQCYALQEVLKEMGNDVFVINYVDHYTEEVYKKISLYLILKKLKNIKQLIRYFRNISHRASKEKLFNDFINHYLNITSKCSNKDIPQDFDIYIVGSDQLWSLNCLGGTEDPVYMGEFNHSANSRIIGYAISTNKQSLEKIGDLKLEKYCNNFNSISLRENSNAIILSKMTGINAHVDIDPTFITNMSTWESLINSKWKNKEYVLTYQARGSKGDVVRKRTKLLAKKFGWEYVDLNASYCSVSDFLSAIYYAQCIVTTSFHAIAFSLIFKKSFYAIALNDGHDARYVDLLNLIGASDAIKGVNFPIEIPLSLDYHVCNKKLNVIREGSISYLRDNIL